MTLSYMTERARKSVYAHERPSCNIIRTQQSVTMKHVYSPEIEIISRYWWRIINNIKRLEFLAYERVPRQVPLVSDMEDNLVGRVK